MSIPLADAVHEIVTPPTTHPIEAFWPGIFIAWLIVSIFIAKLLGAFGRRSILGPPRLTIQESPWLPIFIFLAGLSFPMFLPNLLQHMLPADPNLTVMWQSVAVEGPAFCLILVLTIVIRIDGLQSLGLRPIQILRGVMLGATTLFILFPMVVIVGELTGLVMRHAGLPMPTHEVLRTLQDNPGRQYIAAAIILVVIVAPAFEELAFRGFLQTAISHLFQWLSLARRDGEQFLISPGTHQRWIAVVITAALFAAVHGEIGFFPPLFVLALGLGYLYERTGNLWASIVAHALFNLIQISNFLVQSPR